MKPRIGITYSDEIKVEPYAAAVRASGGEPVVIGPDELGSIHGLDELLLEELLLDGLLLGGGVDVNPALYGEARAPETEIPNHLRDQLELRLLKYALQRNLPVLAICRGMQLLNVGYRGALTQHMDGHVMRTDNKALPAHSVEISRDSKLSGIIQLLELAVNSRHHQAVARLGEGLQVTALGSDGTVEAVEDPSRDLVLGVQWHPEDMAAVDPAQKRLFDALISVAKKKEPSPN